MFGAIEPAAVAAEPAFRYCLVLWAEFYCWLWDEWGIIVDVESFRLVFDEIFWCRLWEAASVW